MSSSTRNIISVFGPDTPLAHLDLVLHNASLALPSLQGPRLYCTAGFCIQYILVTKLTAINGEGNPPCALIIQLAATTTHSSRDFFLFLETGTTHATSRFRWLCFCVSISHISRPHSRTRLEFLTLRHVQYLTSYKHLVTDSNDKHYVPGSGLEAKIGASRFRQGWLGRRKTTSDVSVPIR